MHSTDTKPQSSSFEETSRVILRIAFCAETPLVPPPIVRVPSVGTQIGREVDHGVCLDDARVSRHHATVRRDVFGQLSVSDEQSKNGTFVNGVRIERKPLATGDVISLGDSCLVVAEEPADAGDAIVAGLSGDSPAMRRARSLVQSLGPTPQTVLILGESGCGKEVVARALHLVSGLRGAFVAVNCAAVPESLFESQFFGHGTGAFTGATAHKGFFRAAINGTLFLDEIGELPLVLQSKLLRAIEERAVVPVGSTASVPCAVRIVAATNRDLASEVERGAFRGDLLARLFEAEVTLPPLRARREDILPLFSLALNAASRSMTHALAEALLVHDWPLNVRELFATAREISNSSTGTRLDVSAFRRRLDVKLSVPPRSPRFTPPTASRTDEGVIGSEELAKLLVEKNGSVADVARTVGRSRRQVYRWIQKYGLQIDTFRH